MSLGSRTEIYKRYNFQYLFVFLIMHSVCQLLYLNIYQHLIFIIWYNFYRMVKNNAIVHQGGTNMLHCASFDRFYFWSVYDIQGS